MEASRDSKGGAGCGTLFYIGANDVSDARHAVEIALKQLPKQFGEVYVNDAGHLSFSYTARAGQCCVKTLGAVEGKGVWNHMLRAGRHGMPRIGSGGEVCPGDCDRLSSPS